MLHVRRYQNGGGDGRGQTAAVALEAMVFSHVTFITHNSALGRSYIGIPLAPVLSCVDIIQDFY